MLDAIIAVPFFDTEENGRGELTISCLEHLLNSTHRTVMAIDNGSTDKSAAKWCSGKVPYLHFGKPRSIAHAVNSVWWHYQSMLNRGTGVAIKHDSDIKCYPDDGGWIDKILQIFEEDPDVYLAGLGKEGRDEQVLKDHDWWYETTFVPGGVQVRSPAAWRDIGYSRQPYGRWGWGDHWDAWRVDHLGKKLALLRGYWMDHLHPGALGEEYKQENANKAYRAFEELIRQVKAGERPVREDFDLHDYGHSSEL